MYFVHFMLRILATIYGLHGKENSINMNWIPTFENFVFEYINRETLKDVERHLDRLFKKIDMDIAFTDHFYDRLNHERNKTEITTKELIDAFDSTYKEFGPKLVDQGDLYAAVIQDMKSDVNIPFVLKYNPKSGDLVLVAKTIMRTPHFFSNEPKIKVNK